MSSTNDQARALCPRTCLDCCCEEHHWGDYGPDEDENGDIDLDDNSMHCKHCPAKLGYDEPCVRCERPLIGHDLDTLDCDSLEPVCAPDGQKFAFKGQVVRVCNLIHPWDEEA